MSLGLQIYPASSLHELAATSYEDLSAAQLRVFTSLSPRSLLLVIQQAKEQIPPNEGVIAAAGVLALSMEHTRPAHSSTIVRTVAEEAFPRLNEV